MDGEMGCEHSEGFRSSVRRISEIIGLIGDASHGETLAVVRKEVLGNEILKLVRTFQILGTAYADKLVQKSQEVRVLQVENQMLQNNLEQLQFRSVVPPVLSGSGETNNRNRDAEVNLHLKCEEGSHRRDLELAKLRDAYTTRTFDLRECNIQIMRLESRMQEAENQAAKNETERRELLKKHTEEISRLKGERRELLKKHTEEISRLKGDIMYLKNEEEKLREQLGRANMRNDQFVDLLRRDFKQQDESRRQQKTLKAYLQVLASKLASTQEYADFQIELRGLECMGLDVDTKFYLKTVLESVLKPSQERVRGKHLDSAGLKRAIEVVDLDDDPGETGEQFTTFINEDIHRKESFCNCTSSASTTFPVASSLVSSTKP